MACCIKIDKINKKQNRERIANTISKQAVCKRDNFDWWAWHSIHLHLFKIKLIFFCCLNFYIYLNTEEKLIYSKSRYACVRNVNVKLNWSEVWLIITPSSYIQKLFTHCTQNSQRSIKSINFFSSLLVFYIINIKWKIKRNDLISKQGKSSYFVSFYFISTKMPIQYPSNIHIQDE